MLSFLTSRTSFSVFSFCCSPPHLDLHSFPTRRSSDLGGGGRFVSIRQFCLWRYPPSLPTNKIRSEEHTSELQSRGHLVCRLLLEKKNKTTIQMHVPMIVI